MIFKTIFLTILLVFSRNFLQAQIYKDTTPLHNFFRNHFDSTIIYNQWSSENPYPNYYIIAKQDSSVYYFTYKSAYQKVQGLYYPADLHVKFIQEQGTFKSTTPDTNRYFLPVYIHYSNKILYWSQINSFNVWGLKEVNQDFMECDISDSGFDTYYLITTHGIKHKSFYAADFYERCKPGNINLINQIKTRNTILKIFAN